MELRHLRYFVAVAERKGFREASRFLNISQPAISKTLTQLEQELGVELFARSGRTVRLTAQGEVFYKERTLRQADHAAEAAQRAARGEFGTLTLAFCSVATRGESNRMLPRWCRSPCSVPIGPQPPLRRLSVRSLFLAAASAPET